MFKKGDRVKYITDDHHFEPNFYPPVDTIGTIVSVHKKYYRLLVQWPNGTTGGDGKWFCYFDDVELINDEEWQNE